MQHFSISNRRYTGSKNKLSSWIKEIIKDNLNEEKSFCDIFAGTGIISETCLDIFNELVINDFLFSNEIIYQAFFLNQKYSQEKIDAFLKEFSKLNKNLKSNYFSEKFGSKFFSIEDAKKIGLIREALENRKKDFNKKEYCILLASLIYSADKSANTVGHYDAYRKINNIEDKFKFLPIEPIQHEKKITIHRKDANLLAKELNCEVVYVDPPYNSRQYSRFYHVLENLTQWQKPELFGVAMKPEPENMSDYCKTTARNAFEDLISNLTAKTIIVSYNNTYDSKSSSSKNKISLEEIQSILDAKGKTIVHSKDYKFFNAGKTDFKNHQEMLFVTKVKP